jgi:hypothetical protein
VTFSLDDCNNSSYTYRISCSVLLSAALNRHRFVYVTVILEIALDLLISLRDSLLYRDRVTSPHSAEILIDSAIIATAINDCLHGQQWKRMDVATNFPLVDITIL